MRSALVFAVLFGLVFTLTQGSAIKAQETKSLKTCQEKKIEKLINKIIDDTYALKEDAYEAYENAYSGVIECVISSFTTMVSCVEGVLEDNITDFETEIENYITTVQKLAAKIEEDIEACV